MPTPHRTREVTIRLTGRTWSAILAFIALSRAGSYAFRPPRESVATTLIEGTIPYPTWAVLLTAGAALVVAGLVGSTFTRWRPAEAVLFLGHVVLLGCYATYGLSLFVASVIYDQPWAGVAPIMAVGILHAERILTLGQTLGRR